MPQFFENDLIFLIGLDSDFDAESYLSRGFRIVFVESDPKLALEFSRRLRRYGAQLIVINKELYYQGGREVRTYPEHDASTWSSSKRRKVWPIADRVLSIGVSTVDLPTLFERYGVPCYLKSCVASLSPLLISHLQREDHRPKFVSMVVNSGNEISRLSDYGYSLGHIVNNWISGLRTSDSSTTAHEWKLEMIGQGLMPLSGSELDLSKWRELDVIGEICRSWIALRELDTDLTPGRLDLLVAHGSISNYLSTAFV